MTIIIATRHVRRSAQAVPLAAGCLAAALPAELREETWLRDFYPEHSAADIAAALTDAAPRLVCMPLYSWNRSVMCAAARLLRQALPATLLIAGGPEASALPEEVLAAGTFHALVRGEGETPFAELCRELAAGNPLAPLPGVSLATACRNDPRARGGHWPAGRPFPRPG